MTPSLPSDAPPPEIARRLGHAGLLPFFVGTALVWLVDERAHPYATLALSTFAALVVSFSGGIHWGIAFAHPAPSPSLFAWGVAPSLLAWVAVMMPASAGLVLDGVLLVAGYLIDRHVYPAHGLSRWLTLRFRWSALSAFSCFLAAAGS